MQNLNLGKMDEATKARRWEDAHTLLDFAMLLARIQHQAGRLFVHEHPAGASSWGRPSVKAVMDLEGVKVANFDQCRFGLQAPMNKKPLKKRTRLLTN
eukprot:11826481-Alexandrium_andersonii.AAC.1